MKYENRIFIKNALNIYTIIHENVKMLIRTYYLKNQIKIKRYVHVHNKRVNRFVTKEHRVTKTFEHNMYCIKILTFIWTNMCLHKLHVHLHLWFWYKVDIDYAFWLPSDQ